MRKAEEALTQYNTRATLLSGQRLTTFNRPGFLDHSQRGGYCCYLVLITLMTSAFSLVSPHLCVIFCHCPCSFSFAPAQGPPYSTHITMSVGLPPMGCYLNDHILYLMNAYIVWTTSPHLLTAWYEFGHSTCQTIKYSTYRI